MVYIFLVMSLFLRVLSRMILNITLTVLGFFRELNLQIRTTDSSAFTSWLRYTNTKSKFSFPSYYPFPLTYFLYRWSKKFFSVNAKFGLRKE